MEIRPALSSESKGFFFTSAGTWKVLGGVLIFLPFLCGGPQLPETGGPLRYDCWAFGVNEQEREVGYCLSAPLLPRSGSSFQKVGPSSLLQTHYSII